MALKRSNKIIAGILATVLTLTNMPVIARDWIKTSDNTTTESESEYYYHFSNGYHITWSGSDGQRWSDGEPYSSQSTIVTLKNQILIIYLLPSAQDKTIKEII